MWPFGRKSRSLSELPAISDPRTTWSVVRTDYDGAPLIIRFNTSAKDWRAHPGLPIKLAFALPLKSPNEKGLPDPAENEQLNRIEELILQSVEAATIGLAALVLTTGVMKEAVFYIPSGVDIKSLHQSIARCVSTHEVQCMAVVDKQWDAYKAFGLP